MTQARPGQPLPAAGPDVERWYGEYHVRLLKFLRHSLRTETDAEDVSQEVFLRLLRIPEDRVVEHPKAYLFRVAVNVVNDWRADQRMCETRPPDDFDKLETARASEEDYDADKRLEAIEAAIRSLPVHYRATMMLKTRDGLSYKEIAAHLGVSERMVKRYVVKGYARLREALQSLEAA